jgi:DNA-binding transcriptional LysR family regulator
MNNNSLLREPDWSLWRSFEAVVAEGSLSAAARKVNLSQPTLGRHIDALERDLGVTLFDRTLNGFKPTEAALKLYEPVKTAQQALANARNIAEGQNEQLSGTVRITASQVFMHYSLPKMLKTIRHDYPAIALEFVPTDTAENLLLREADIAIRMFRPTQLDLITKHIGEIPIVFCAHEDYLRQRGTPQHLKQLFDHDLIGLDRSDLIIRTARDMALFADRSQRQLQRTDFVLRSDSQTMMWEMLRAGLGIGFAQISLVAQTPGMMQILPDVSLPPLPIWLTTHRELFTSRRIRVIYDALATQLGTHVALAHKLSVQQN